MKQDYGNLPKEVISAIEILESYIAEKEDELTKIRKVINEAKDANPLISGGYFRFTAYVGSSEKIKVGKVYKGYTYKSVNKDVIRGHISKINANFSSKNASWVLATKEEYIKQQKDEKAV